MRGAKYALVYFGTAGVIILLLAGLLLLTLLGKYNETRKVDILHATATFMLFALGQSLLIAGVVAYVTVRKSYTPPPIPPMPPASVVALIPAYNEEVRVGSVVREARKYVDLVIVVDDGSSDNTAREAEEAGAVVIRHPQNMGKGAAVATLIKAALAAGAKYAVILDADGQHDPADIPKLIQALKDGADHVVGNRFPTTKMPALRRFGYKALALIHRVLVSNIKDPFSGYRAFTDKALQLLNQDFDPSYGVETEINYHLRGVRTVEIPIEVRYHEFASKANPVLQGLNIFWSIIWTFLTKSPVRTLVIGAVLLSISIVLLQYVIDIFNLTRYIRLTYTAVTMLLEIIAAILIALAIASIIKK